MTYNADMNRRRSIRLRGFDYASAGAYFVTICAFVGAGSPRPECLFGRIIYGEMELSEAGRMVTEWWLKLPDRFPGVTLDDYVVMPNHFHGIVMIDAVGAGSPRPFSTDCQHQGGATPPLRRPTLGQIVGYFKYQTTKQINIVRDNPGVPVWQRNYYERIIRNDEELIGIREYIQDNPADWEGDDEYPE